MYTVEYYDDIDRIYVSEMFTELEDAIEYLASTPVNSGARVTDFDGNILVERD